MTARLEPAASLEEIAETEGMSVGAVRMTLTRALKKLRTCGLLCPVRELAQELDRNRKGIVE